MAYTRGRIQTQKRKLGGAYFKEVHKQEKQKQQGGLHQGIYRNTKKKRWRGLTPRGVYKQG